MIIQKFLYTYAVTGLVTAIYEIQGIYKDNSKHNIETMKKWDKMIEKYENNLKNKNYSYKIEHDDDYHPDFEHYDCSPDGYKSSKKLENVSISLQSGIVCGLIWPVFWITQIIF